VPYSLPFDHATLFVYDKLTSHPLVALLLPQHLDKLDMTDIIFIGINKMSIPPFVYLLLRWCHNNPTIIPYSFSDLTLWNTIVPIPILFVVYDLPYSLAHRFLHLQSVYPLIHKHHHKQKAPSRGNVDAVNVHPLEFHTGEYIHWLSVYLITKAGFEVHFLTVAAFLFMGGLMASLNHTRFDVEWSFGGFTLYDPKVHDVHHRLPRTNYGQYIMLWDKVLGTYRGYREEDRIVMEDQLTGKYDGVSKSGKVKVP